MFADYDETYGDIDQYYDEVYTLFPSESKINTSPPVNVAPTPTAKIDTSASNTIANILPKSLTNVLPAQKQQFEVSPNQLIDGMPIGTQPKYNVLYSKNGFEGLKNKFNSACTHASSNLDSTIMIIIFFILILVIINLSSKVNRLSFMVGHLMYEKHLNAMNQKNKQ